MTDQLLLDFTAGTVTRQEVSTSSRYLNASFAAAARDEAIARVDDHADPEWKDEAYNVIRHLALTRPEFISDACWETLEKPHEARALGPVMRRAARDGLIRSTDRVRPSAQKGCNAMPRVVWQSLVYGGAK